MKAHCLALKLCSVLANSSLTICTLCTAVRLLVDIGELGRAATLLQEAEDELGCIATPPECLVCTVDVEKCWVLWHQGKISEACQCAMDLFGRPLMEQRYQISFILQARLYSLCSCLLSVESCDPSLSVCLKKRMKSFPLTRLEPLLDAVNIWTSLANVKKIDRKGTEVLLTDQRPDLVWVVLNELMKAIIHLSSIYFEQQLSANCTGLLNDGLHMSEAFELHGWQSRFHRCLSDNYAVMGDTEKYEHHLRIAEALKSTEVEDPVAVKDRILLSLAHTRSGTSHTDHLTLVDELCLTLSGYVEKFEDSLKNHDPQMILPIKKKEKIAVHTKGLKRKKKQPPVVDKNKLLTVCLIEVLAVKAELCLADKDFSQCVELSERGMTVMHVNDCRRDEQCHCPLLVTEPVLAARLLYCRSAGSLGLNNESTESGNHRYVFDQVLSKQFSTLASILISWEVSQFNAI